MIQAVKDYLNISFDDEMTNRMLESAITRGESIIDSYAGTHQDYETEGAARQLLFDYCRYVRSQATELFEVNYKRDLMALREASYAENKNTD